MKKLNKMRFISLLVTLFLVVMMAVPSMSMAAEAPVDLGTTESFAVLAGQTITNTGATTITGDIGLHPGSSITHEADITRNGARHVNDSVAITAKTDLVAAYNDAVGRALTPGLQPVDLGGLTLGPGVYSSGGAFGITGTLTLDAKGNPDAVFIFKSASTLITAVDSKVILTGGARFCRVFWPVASSATLGVNSVFVGHIFAKTSITADNGANVEGQLLAMTGAVNLNHNVIKNEICAPATAIHIAKTSSPTALTSGPGLVTYTYEVTNPGTVALGSIVVKDDKISSLPYVSGDNGNRLLEPSEKWIYRAKANLNATTTNTATATGSANGVTVTDSAVATVVVSAITGGVTTTVTGGTGGVTTTVTGGTGGVTTTVTGGQLPKTSTPLYELFLIGAVLTLVGAVGWRSRKRYD